MSPTSYQLLYPAMLDCKGKTIFLNCKIYITISISVVSEAFTKGK